MAIKVGRKTVEIRELTIGDAKLMKSKIAGFADMEQHGEKLLFDLLFDTFEEFLAMATNLEGEEIDQLTFSDLQEMEKEFMDLNAPFFAYLARFGLTRENLANMAKDALAPTEQEAQTEGDQEKSPAETREESAPTVIPGKPAPFPPRPPATVAPASPANSGP